MNRATVLLVAGVFLGGATPWLEAVVVVPGGIVAGLNPVVAVVAGTSGNLLTVALAAFFGERIRGWWLRRRAGRDGGADGAGTPSRRAARVERLARRWGLPALAVVGPIGLGTQVSTVVAVGMGTDARTAFAWIGAGTLAWSLLAAVAAVAGLSVLGAGA